MCMSDVGATVGTRNEGNVLSMPTPIRNVNAKSANQHAHINALRAALVGIVQLIYNNSNSSGNNCRITKAFIAPSHSWSFSILPPSLGCHIKVAHFSARLPTRTHTHIYGPQKERSTCATHPTLLECIHLSVLT